MKRTSGARATRLGSRVLLISALLTSLGLVACQKFSAGNGSGGNAGDAGDGEPPGGAGSAGTAGSAGAVSPNGGSTSAGAAGMTMGSGGSAGQATAGSGGTLNSGGNAGSAGANAGGPATSECPCSAPTPTCELGHCVSRGPSMVKVESFYIDSTEVTNAQYAVFEKAKGADSAGQSAECTWNTSYDPVFEQGAPAVVPTRPVTNIDFCDAKAYCAWADKRLCGRIAGGAINPPELADTTQSQWYAACAGPKSQSYPYGTTYSGGACNDNSMSLLEVGSKAKCQGYYPGLYDMLGNAQEWVDACITTLGAGDTCERIGGSYTTGGSQVTCSTSGAATRDAYAQSVGFRCCSVAPSAMAQ